MAPAASFLALRQAGARPRRRRARWRRPSCKTPLAHLLHTITTRSETLSPIPNPTQTPHVTDRLQGHPEAPHPSPQANSRRPMLHFRPPATASEARERPGSMTILIFALLMAAAAGTAPVAATALGQTNQQAAASAGRPEARQTNDNKLQAIANRPLVGANNSSDSNGLELGKFRVASSWPSLSRPLWRSRSEQKGKK